MRVVAMLSLSVCACGFVALCLAWPLIVEMTTSPYSCPSYGKLSVAFKDLFLVEFSYGIGICVGTILFFGILPWWLASAKVTDKTSEAIELEELFSLAMSRSDLLSAANLSLFIKYTWITFIITSVAALTILPNIVYVIVMTSNYSASEKELSVGLIALFKSISACSITPTSARSLINDIFPVHQYGSNYRFQARLAVSILISVLFTFMAPLLIVLATSSSCFFDSWIQPIPQEVTDISIRLCDYQAPDGSCTSYGQSVIQSIYQPTFEYSGATCVSAVLFTYTPVFHATVLLLATIPALLDLVCYDILMHINGHPEAFGAQYTRVLILRLSSIVDVRSNNSGAPSQDELLALRFRAQRLVEKAYTKLIFVLLIAMTFGLAVPVTCGVCVFSALVIMVHHLVLMEHCRKSGHNLFSEDISFRLPLRSGACLGSIVSATWMLTSVDYFSFTEINVGMWGALFLLITFPVACGRQDYWSSYKCCPSRSVRSNSKATGLSTLNIPFLKDEVNIDDCDHEIKNQPTDRSNLKALVLADEMNLDECDASGRYSDNDDKALLVNSVHLK